MPPSRRTETARRERAELAELHRRLSCLTPREREVLPLVVSGLLNKQAAAELGISEITIQIHRGKIMKKMEAGLAGRAGENGWEARNTAQPRQGKSKRRRNSLIGRYHESGMRRCGLRRASPTAVRSSCPLNGFLNSR